jgi:uncharacterized surface protein with fasciclin (FAS1) repeats
MASILDTVFTIEGFKIFSAAVKATDLDKTLNTLGNFTIFAPNDRAFSRLSKIIMEQLSGDIPLLTKILSLHIIRGKLTYLDLLKMCKHGEQTVRVVSIDGSWVGIDLSDGIRLGGSTVVSTNTSADNGIIHLIDRVLIPKFEGEYSV